MSILDPSPHHFRRGGDLISIYWNSLFLAAGHAPPLPSSLELAGRLSGTVLRKTPPHRGAAPQTMPLGAGPQRGPTRLRHPFAPPPQTNPLGAGHRGAVPYMKPPPPLLNPVLEVTDLQVNPWLELSQLTPSPSLISWEGVPSSYQPCVGI